MCGDGAEFSMRSGSREVFIKHLKGFYGVAELDYFLQLEHILRVAKARAEQMLARAS